jgi:hypothetical protein
MSRVKVRRHTSYSVEDDDGNEFEVQFEPVNGSDVTIEKLPDGRTVVGYLSHDPNCGNPLEDCDGSGKLYRWDHRDHKDEIRAALGLDQYNSRDPELKPNPHAVLLDKYEHGLEKWYPSTGGDAPGDPGGWDTSRGAGVWVPDKSCLEHIRSSAVKYLLPEGTDVNYESKSNPDGTAITRPCRPGEKPYFEDGTCIDERYHNVITLTLPDGTKKGGYKSFDGAYRAAARILGDKLNAEALREGERRAARKCAKNACDEYTAWGNGECYGVCVEVFDADGERVSDDACWGHVGSDWAEQALAEEMAHTVKRLTKEK